MTDMTAGDMQALMRDIFGQTVPHIDELGIELVERQPRGLVLRLPYQTRLIGNPDDGVLFGGAISTLIDTACGFSAMIALPKLGPVATLDLRVDYLRPTAPGSDILVRAECYKLTRRIAFCRATAFNEESDDPVAEALGTFMIPDSAGPADAGAKA